jgi:hypothetical protein
MKIQKPLSKEYLFIIKGLGREDFEKFKKNTNEYSYLRSLDTYILHRKTCYDINFIYAAFPWVLAPEGFGYWNDINIKWEKYIQEYENTKTTT